MASLIRVLPFIMLLFFVSGEATAFPRHLPAAPPDLDLIDAETSLERLIVAPPGLVDDYMSFLRILVICREEQGKDCLDAIEWFLAYYDDSPVRDDLLLYKLYILARMIEKNNYDLTGSREGLLSSFFSSYREYASRYPEDRRAKLLHGEVLESTGRKRQALRVYRRLLLSGDRYYFLLRQHLPEIPLKVTEIISLAGDLARERYLEEAETLLLNLLEKKPATRMREIYRGLGEIYFRKKLYLKAARYLFRGNDRYRTAVSFFRAAHYEEFEKTLASFGRVKSEDTCRLHLLRGLKRRRAGDFEGALRIFRHLYRSGYPCREDALWHIAWAEYLSGNYLSASSNFLNLSRMYNNPRYYYWYERTREKMGQRPVYTRLLKDEHPASFYSVMVILRNGDGKMEIPGDWVAFSMEGDRIRLVKKDPALQRVLERADLLSRSGLYPFGLRELLGVEPEDGELRVSLCFGLLSIGAYDEAIRCARDLPEQRRAEGLLYPLGYREVVLEEAGRYGVDPALILAVIREESRFMKDAFSGAGAVGLMQLMPKTAKRIARESGLSLRLTGREDLTVPESNILLGTHYLRLLLDEFGSIPPAVAAYNAGEKRVRAWLDAFNYEGTDEFIEDIPFRETKYYVMRVMRSYLIYRELMGIRSRPPF